MKNRLRALRFAAGYKSDSDKDIESFAFYHGTTPENVKKWEAQKGIPNYAFASTICKRFGVPIEFLYGYEIKTTKEINTLAQLTNENIGYECWEQDYNKEDMDYQEFIEFKKCGGYFEKKFNIACHLDALTNLQDIQSAREDHILDETDWAIADYIRVLTADETNEN